jgi:putative salt-induced outer membrane protein
VPDCFSALPLHFGGSRTDDDTDFDTETGKGSREMTTRRTVRTRLGCAARTRRAAWWLAALLLAGTPGPARAQEAEAEEVAQAAEEPAGWTGSGKLGVVATSGNTETQSVSGRVEADREWTTGTLRLEASALRAEQTDTTLRAVGPTPDDVTILSISESEPTAESYAATAQYDRDLTERLFAFGSVGWERDEPAGIADRFAVGLGAGHTWVEREDLDSRTGYGLTYTREEGTSGIERDFAGVRLSWDHRQDLTETTTYTHALVVNENLDDTDDLRADLLASIAVSMTERLALEVSGQLKYDAQPAFQAVPRELPDGTPAGDTVLVELEELDTVLSVALVVKL